ncbi:hypothetical protein Tco_0040402 [Tanacetum coccineum]
MNPQEKQQVVAHDDKWVPFSERVKIRATNIRLETIVPQKEKTFQVVIDLIKNSTYFKAFTISADVLKIFMQQFWYSIKKLQGTDYYEFLLANKKSTVNAEVFWTILDICPRGEGVDFTDVPDDDTTLTFLIDLSYTGPLYKHTNMFVDHMHQPWRTLETIINKCSSSILLSKSGQEKVTFSAADNIIPDPDVALELGKSISITEAKEEKAAKQVHATHARIVIESVLESAKEKTSRNSKSKPKGVPSLTLEEQEDEDIMQSLKERKKTSKIQPGTEGSSEGTGTKPGVPNESTVVFATSSEGTDSEFSNVDNDDVEKDDKDDDADDEGDDHIKIRVRKDDDDELINAEVDNSNKGDEEITDAARVNAKNILEVKDDPKKAELPPSSSSLYVSLGFGDQFLKLSSDSSLVSTVKDIVDSKINSFLEVKIQSEVPHTQSPSMLSILVYVISEPTVLTPVQESPLIATITTLPPLYISTTPYKEQAEKQQKLKFTIKSTDKEALEEYDLKSALYQSMHANKSFNINPANHLLYHALMKALIEDENAIDKDVAHTVKDNKRKHDDDDDEDPLARPKHGKKTKRKRAKESKSSKKPSSTKETLKGKALTKGSKTSKSVSAKEPV